jgi:hypothetical protein
MDLSEVVVAWTPLHWEWHPTAGEIRVGLASDGDWKAQFGMTEGATDIDWKSASYREKRLFVLFHQIVVRDHIDPQIAHEAFLAIDEYRRQIASDIAGAEERPE